MIFLALKTEDGRITGKISFYCRMLGISRQGFYKYLANRKYLKDRGVQIESWGPFAEGKNNFFQNPVLVETGKRYGKTAAQTALRFLIQSGVVAIPKSTHRERMEENFQIFDFALTEEEMQKIRALDTGESLFFSHYDPKTVEWFMTFA